MEERIKSTLIGIVGEKNFTDNLIDLVSYSYDASEHRHRPFCAVWGETAEQVSEIMQLANREKIPIIPRIITELAHSRTGIDIHPGATIGKNFFIDHGTGTVIGETCVIGDDVVLYQNVTLGSLNFPRDEEGEVIRDLKRHPTVGNNVIIYSGATILGGETTVGNNVVVGGNAWVTCSIPDDTKVLAECPALRMKGKGASGK